MSVVFTMAESEKKENTVYKVHESEHQETDLPPLKSSVKTPGGASPIKNLVRMLSFSKKRENEEPETKDNSTGNNTQSSSTETKEDGFFRRLSTVRKSFTRREKCTSIEENYISEDNSSDSIVKREGSKKSLYNFAFQNISETHLAAMQINDLIQNKSLEEAYINLLSMRLEVQREQKALGEKAMSVELIHKEKDLCLLFNNLKDQLTEIVRESCILPSYDKELLVQVAAIIQEEERNKGEMGGLGVWKAAIQDGVRETLSEVHLHSHEQNASCIAVHLECLGKKIVEHLEKAKTDFVDVYQPSFKVFETCVLSCHAFVEEHLKDLLKNVTELKDFHKILDFIDCYQSEKILGSPSFQPKMKEMKSPTLSDNVLDLIRKGYCDCLKKDLKESVQNIINIESETIWKKKEPPRKTEDGKFQIAQVHMDMIKKYTNNCGKLDGNLKKNVVCNCIEALKDFPERFEKEFEKQNSSLLGSDLLDCCLWAQYHIAYINSFSLIKEDMEGYKDTCPHEVKQLQTELDGVVDQLGKALLKQFRTEIGPYLGNMMTKEWLSTDTDFNELTNRIETYSGFCKSMKHPPAKAFANDVHYHVVKGYISELLKNKFSCKGRKNDIAGTKIREQYEGLNKLFQQMGSTMEWLYPLGDQLSVIIEQEHEKDIKQHLSPLVKNYSDISKKQISAILSFRDNGFRFEKSQVIQHFNELKQKVKTDHNGNQEQTFFSDIK
ncbi:exocyst complex component 3-like protein 4 isoform X2 [Trichomycterus rosablanca]|uniref:exocyst complex component 3-like protein 4 isoform X2 n=1 Tax=Trichomycterus rosablanca TaxID=2290929 RepID=UPI002F35BBBF